MQVMTKGSVRVRVTGAETVQIVILGLNKYLIWIFCFHFCNPITMNVSCPTALMPPRSASTFVDYWIKFKIISQGWKTN